VKLNTVHVSVGSDRAHMHAACHYNSRPLVKRYPCYVKCRLNAKMLHKNAKFLISMTVRN